MIFSGESEEGAEAKAKGGGAKESGMAEEEEGREERLGEDGMEGSAREIGSTGGSNRGEKKGQQIGKVKVQRAPSY